MSCDTARIHIIWAKDIKLLTPQKIATSHPASTVSVATGFCADTMGAVRIFLPLVFALCIPRSYGTDPFPIDLSTLCNTATPVTISSANHLLVGDNLHVEECNVTVQSGWKPGKGHPYQNWLMILIEVLNMPCREGTRMQFFNGSTTSNDIISWPPTICSDNPYQTWYLVKNSTMGIRISAAPDRRFLNMKLLVTATSFELEEAIDNFVCTNQLRIVSSLKCDGDNNCGDGSDETEQLCHSTKTVEKEKTYRIATIVLGVAVVLLVALLLYCRGVCRNCREKCGRKDPERERLNEDRRPPPGNAE